MSLGTVHSIVTEALQKAQRINNGQELSGIDVGIADEICQASKLMLVGMDAKSTYCYLVAAEGQRDQSTWGVHLLELTDKGLHPDCTVADRRSGLRAGQAAWDDVPCHGHLSMPKVNSETLPFSLRIAPPDVPPCLISSNARYDGPKTEARAESLGD